MQNNCGFFIYKWKDRIIMEQENDVKISDLINIIKKLKIGDACALYGIIIGVIGGVFSLGIIIHNRVDGSYEPSYYVVLETNMKEDDSITNEKEASEDVITTDKNNTEWKLKVESKVNSAVPIKLGKDYVTLIFDGKEGDFVHFFWQQKHISWKDTSNPHLLIKGTRILIVHGKEYNFSVTEIDEQKIYITISPVL